MSIVPYPIATEEPPTQRFDRIKRGRCILRAGMGLEDSMSSEGPGQFLRCAPYFPVVDVGQSTEYYERFLGFRVEYTGGTPPRFAIVSRDGFPIMFRAVAVSARISPNEMQGGTWDAFFWVRDLRALHAELRASGVDIAYGPIVQDEYQMEEFAVRDPNGYVLGFGQPVTAR